MKIAFSFTVLLISLNTWSFTSNSKSDFKFKLEPLFGFENVYRSFPTPHTTTQTHYGVRLTAGLPELSGEAEYVQGNSTETYAVAPETVKYKDENYKLGLKSIFKISDLLSASARAGAQAKKTKREEINAGTSTTTDEPTKISPYAGAQLGLSLGGKMTVYLGTTVIFNDTNDMSKNDYQNSVSFSVGI